MIHKKPRAKVICAITCEGKYLFIDSIDPGSNERFLIPVGGGLEFQETTAEAAVREVKEEVDTDIKAPVLLGVTENIFEYNNKPEHEIIFVYRAEVDQAQKAAMGAFGIEANGEPLKLIWLAKEDLKKSQHLFVPRDLHAMLEEN